MKKDFPYWNEEQKHVSYEAVEEMYKGMGDALVKNYNKHGHEIPEVVSVEGPVLTVPMAEWSAPILAGELVAHSVKDPSKVVNALHGGVILGTAVSTYEGAIGEGTAQVAVKLMAPSKDIVWDSVPQAPQADETGLVWKPMPPMDSLPNVPQGVPQIMEVVEWSPDIQAGDRVGIVGLNRVFKTGINDVFSGEGVAVEDYAGSIEDGTAKVKVVLDSKPQMEQAPEAQAQEDEVVDLTPEEIAFLLGNLQAMLDNEGPFMVGNEAELCTSIIHKLS